MTNQLASGTGRNGPHSATVLTHRTNGEAGGNNRRTPMNKSRLVGLASISLVVAFTATSLLAQTPTASQPGNRAATGSSPATGQTVNPGSAPNPGAAGATGKGTTGPGASSTSGSSAGSYTANNVTAVRPFGDIDVRAAGSTDQSVRTWAQGRSAAERAEISSRCQVITNASNASRYPMDAQQFCRTYMMTASANPAGKSGTTNTR